MRNSGEEYDSRVARMPLIAYDKDAINGAPRSINSLSLRACGLEFGEDETDAADQVVGGGGVGREGEELHGEGAGVGAEDETTLVVVDEAQEESAAAADGVERGLVGAVGGQGVVVAVEHGDGSGGEEGFHGGGLLGVGANGQKALPVGVAGGRAGAIVVEARGRDLNGFDDGCGGDAGFVHGGGGGDDGDDFNGFAGLRGSSSGGEVEREDLVYGEVLGGEDAIEAFKGEGSFAVEEVGDVGLLEACLLGETSAGESASFDAAEEFEAEELVQVLKIHCLGCSLGETISLDKTKIKRKLHFEQHIFFVNYGLLVIYGKRLSEERYRLTEVLSKAITLRLSKTGRGRVRHAILMKDIRERLELHPDQRWKAMQGGSDFSQVIRPH